MANTFGYVQAKGTIHDAVKQEQGSMSLAPLNYFDIINDSQASYVQITKGGKIVEAETGVSLPVQNLEVSFEPVQDLNGYDNPWPPGGGKNLLAPDGNNLPYSMYGVTVTAENGYYKVVASSASGYPFARIGTLNGLRAGNYTISAELVSGLSNSNFVLRLMDRTTNPATTIAASYGAGVAFVVSSDITNSIYIEIALTGANLTDGTYTIKPQLESGSTATAWSPYSNICPITGYTSLDIFREASYDAGATPEISVTWQDDAGTVYGGTLNVTTGELTATYGRKLFDGSESWALHGSVANWYYVDNAITDAFVDATLSNFAISNMYVQNRYDVATDMPTGHFALGKPISTVTRFIVKDTSYATVADFKTALSSNNIQLVYTLATPLTYQLDPEELVLQEGTNVIWSDVGPLRVTFIGFNPLFTSDPLAVGITTLN